MELKNNSREKKQTSEAGVLYVVGTPIGNLGDMSPRALEILGSVDFIAAEDTRVSGKLLSLYNIKKPFLSCHEHNILKRSKEITARLSDGESCAIITDAGMPCISDPGEELVRLCAEQGIKIEVIPGPCALIAALAVSGLPTARFSFEGFLSVTKKQRTARLDEIKNYPHTLIFYEAPHKLKNTLCDLYSTLGDRKIALCRELTKLHEEVLRGKISDMVNLYGTDDGENNSDNVKKPKGEYVLVIEGFKADDKSTNYTIEEAIKIANELIEEGLKQTLACKQASEITGFSKSDIYRELAK